MKTSRERFFDGGNAVRLSTRHKARPADQNPEKESQNLVIAGQPRRRSTNPASQRGSSEDLGDPLDHGDRQMGAGKEMKHKVGQPHGKTERNKVMAKSEMKGFRGT